MRWRLWPRASRVHCPEGHEPAACTAVSTPSRFTPLPPPEPGVFGFAELLQLPQVAALADNPETAPALAQLRGFSQLDWAGYAAAVTAGSGAPPPENLPPAAQRKLRALTLARRARGRASVPLTELAELLRLPPPQGPRRADGECDAGAATPPPAEGSPAWTVIDELVRGGLLTGCPRVAIDAEPASEAREGGGHFQVGRTDVAATVAIAAPSATAAARRVMGLDGGDVADAVGGSASVGGTLDPLAPGGGMLRVEWTAPLDPPGADVPRAWAGACTAAAEGLRRWEQTVRAAAAEAEAAGEAARRGTADARLAAWRHHWAVEAAKAKTNPKCGGTEPRPGPGGATTVGGNGDGDGGRATDPRCNEDAEEDGGAEGVPLEITPTAAEAEIRRGSGGIPKGRRVSPSI